MGPREIIIIAIVVVLLFGAPKLPQMARAIGKSMRILKSETKSLTDDDEPSTDKDSDIKAESREPKDSATSATDRDLNADSTVDTSGLDDDGRDQR